MAAQDEAANHVAAKDEAGPYEARIKALLGRMTAYCTHVFILEQEGRILGLPPSTQQAT